MCTRPHTVFQSSRLAHEVRFICAERSNVWKSEAKRKIHIFNGKYMKKKYKGCASDFFRYQNLPSSFAYHKHIMICKLNCELSSGFLKTSVLMKADFSTNSANQGSEDHPHLASLGRQVIESARQVDIMAGTVSLTNVVTLLKDLQALGFDLKQLTRILSQRVWLLRDTEGATALFQRLQSHGFHNSAVLEIVEQLPVSEKNLSVQQILQITSSSLENMRTLGFSEKELQSFVASAPGLLFTDLKTITQMLHKLKSYFKAADALQIVKKCPNVLVDSFSEIQKKFDYAHFTMGYQQPQIVKSNFFQHPLEYIQDRHLFLRRAGFFVTVKQKDDPRLNPNPPLKDVVDSPVSVFVRKYGRMSIKDYETFLKMREFEREFEDDDNDDLDERSDDSESELEEEQEKRKRKGKSKKGKR